MNIIPKSIICYLYYNHPIHSQRFFISLDLLYKNFLTKWNYPVLVLYEDNDIEHINHIQSKYLDVKFYFHKIDFTLDYPQKIISQIPIKFKGHWDESAYFSMGYRHMCRLYAGKIFTIPFLDNVQYLLRIDSDSYFYNEIPYDPFEKMKENNYLYGSVGIEEDMDYVIEGLYDTVKQYWPGNTKTSQLKYNGMFKTHFDLTNFQWFKQNYMDYFNFIDSTGNIFIKRWGDAPIRYMGVKMLIPDNQIHIFDDIPYKHGGDFEM